MEKLWERIRLSRTGRKIIPYFRALVAPVRSVSAVPFESLPSEERKREFERVRALVAQPMLSERDQKRVEIIVLNYNAPDVESKCAGHIIKYTQWPYKLVLYDNRQGIKNFSRTWNRLLRETTCDYVIIMDSDAFVQPSPDPCWLTRMMQSMEDSSCYVVVPRVTKTSTAAQRYQETVAIPPTMLDVPYAGQCVLFRKEIFGKIGPFDEDFLLYGQDMEWACRFLARGYRPVLRHDVLVDHLGHYSVKKSQRTEPLAFLPAAERAYADELLKQKCPGTTFE